MQFAPYFLPILGGLLCLFAVGQLGFWAAQSWQMSFQNRRQFELARTLLREQIEASRKRLDSKLASGQADVQPSKSTLELEPQVSADGTWKGFRAFKVVKANKETPSARSIYLQPIDDHPIASFRPGQHLAIRLKVPGQSKPVVRCYSLSNGAGQGTYRLTIKAIPELPGQPETKGLVSNYINDDLEVGSIVDVKAPAGRFVLDESSQQPIVMLAGGIGITPMISMIEHQLAQGSSRLMVLVYGARSRYDQAFKLWLDQRAAEHQHLIVVHCLSAPGQDEIQGQDYQVKGRVSVELLEQLLPDRGCQYYLCGPAAFMDSLTEGLRNWGVPESSIFSEAFGPAARPAKAKPGAEVNLDQQIQVEFQRSGPVLSWNPQHGSLLELAEIAGVEIESSCRSGNCGTCAVRLLAGQVEYEDPGVECEPGECLTCVGRPAASGGKVVLDA